MIIAEIMKSSTEKTILLLMAMGLALLPAPLAVACDATPHSDADPCGILMADTCDAPAGGRESGHGNDNCCETGCQDCSLPCCSGTAMIPTDAQMVDAALTSDGRLATTTTDLTWVDPDPLYHPPRA